MFTPKIVQNCPLDAEMANFVTNDFDLLKIQPKVLDLFYVERAPAGASGAGGGLPIGARTLGQLFLEYDFLLN